MLFVKNISLPDKDVHYAFCSRLSGESPFQGNNDAETLASVTAARYEFDPETFEDISDEAKDFISSLLKKDRRLACFHLHRF